MKKILCLCLFLAIFVSGCDKKTNEEIHQMLEDDYAIAVFADDYGTGYIEGGRCINIYGTSGDCTLTPGSSVANLSYYIYDETNEWGIRVYPGDDKKIVFVHKDGHFIVENEYQYVYRVGKDLNPVCYFSVENDYIDEKLNVCGTRTIEKSEMIIDGYKKALKKLGFTEDTLLEYIMWAHDNSIYEVPDSMFIDELLRINGLGTYFDFSETNVYINMDGTCMDNNLNSTKCPHLAKNTIGRLYVFIVLDRNMEVYAYLERMDDGFSMHSATYTNYEKDISYNFYNRNSQRLGVHGGDYFSDEYFSCDINDYGKLVGYDCDGADQHDAKMVMAELDHNLMWYGLNKGSIISYFKWVCEEYSANIYTE